MGKKKTPKKIDDKSKLDIFATPVTKRNLNATYVKSASRLTFPNNLNSRKDAVIIKNSKKLIELGLAESQWKTYRINALYGFKYQKPMLRRYEKKLKSIVQADISRIGPESPYYNLKFEVEMQYFYSMAFTKNDSPPLKIIIDTEDGNENDVYFTGVLVSVERIWRGGFMERERRYANAAILPLFLVAYTDRVFFESVKCFLESNFSCLVSPLKFTSDDLMWMLALCSSKEYQHSGVSHIEYASPFQELKTIQLAFDPYTIVEVWNNFVDLNSAKENQTVCNKQVYQFLSTLEYHFFKTFRINLSELDLQLIRTPLATVTANQSVLLNDTEKLYFVMRLLTHLAQETLTE